MTKRERTGSVDGRKIVVLDGILAQPRIARLTQALKAGAFRRTEFARDETKDVKHWAGELAQLAPELGDQLLVRTEREVHRRFGADMRPYRAYCNVALYGDVLMTHEDCSPRDEVVTALWYVCTEWNVEWGGETLFFDRRDDAAFVVSPKPGRLVLFDGAITHAGRPPSRICHEPRFTLAFKFARNPTPRARRGRARHG